MVLMNGTKRYMRWFAAALCKATYFVGRNALSAWTRKFRYHVCKTVNAREIVNSPPALGACYLTPLAPVFLGSGLGVGSGYTRRAL